MQPVNLTDRAFRTSILQAAKMLSPHGLMLSMLAIMLTT